MNDTMIRYIYMLSIYTKYDVNMNMKIFHTTAFTYTLKTLKTMYYTYICPVTYNTLLLFTFIQEFRPSFALFLFNFLEISTLEQINKYTRSTFSR